MDWRKEFDYPSSFSFYIGIIILLLFASLYLEALFFIGITSLALAIMSIYYVRYITNHLYIENTKRTVRLFSEDEDVLYLTLRNTGKLPIFNSTLTFFVDKQISIMDLREIANGKVKDSYQIPLTIMPNETKQYQLKIKANKRGSAKISDIKLEVKDILGMIRGIMYFDPIFKSEMIVYPTLAPVKNMERLVQIEQGERQSPYSYFQDPTLTVGTRDYVSSDSFKQIHWKASARKPELQTKIFEKTTSLNWTFILNITSTKENGLPMMDPNLEQNISYTAFLCQYAVQKNIPFSIYVNVRTIGRLPIYHLDVGQGRVHLMKAFELLARIRKDSITTPMYRMLNIVDRTLNRRTVIILIGDISGEKDQAFYSKWQNAGRAFYQIDENGNTIPKRRQVKGRGIS